MKLFNSACCSSYGANLEMGGCSSRCQMTGRNILLGCSELKSEVLSLRRAITWLTGGRACKARRLQAVETCDHGASRWTFWGMIPEGEGTPSEVRGHSAESGGALG